MKNHLLVLLFVNGVFCAGTDKVETLEVMEGEPVTLDTCCVIEIQTKDEIEWRFDGAVIAKNGLMDDTDDGKFTGRLSLNPQTGDLTIRNTRIQHSGLYEAIISSSARTVHMKFNVNVLDALPTKVSETEGSSFTFPHDIADVQKYDLITWIFENTTIAEFNRQRSPSIEYYGDVKDGKFKDRLKMDDQSRALTITDIKSTDSGLYKVQVIVQNQETKTRAYRLSVSASVSPAAYIVPILLILAVVVGGIIFVCKSKQSEHKAVSGNEKEASQEDLRKE
ncbi:uncharacterized protein LOC130548770 [Triplophysa rosa]|uniref:Ig-like domain-containing protein n=1 Tax=Triplophysa rosa TaxID=992332 RepID=A0A9W7T787_TRIRA|nr:uncharacterized protein LOC130548770 [Triplophysa rosa]KAI7790882.1 hypothetical protein IRJ41_003599 [Triplophysa rosa]